MNIHVHIYKHAFKHLYIQHMHITNICAHIAKNAKKKNGLQAVLEIPDLSRRWPPCAYILILSMQHNDKNGPQAIMEIPDPKPQTLT